MKSVIWCFIVKKKKKKKEKYLRAFKVWAEMISAPAGLLTLYTLSAECGRASSKPEVCFKGTRVKKVRIHRKLINSSMSQYYCHHHTLECEKQP